MLKCVWLNTAYKYLGQREIVGTRHNPLIVRMFSLIKMSGIKDDETPWCAAFVGSCLEEVGIRSTRSAWALSYETFGTKCDAQVGAIAYKKRFNSANKLIGGHVFFVVGQTSDGRILALGGNQGNAVSIVSYDKRDIVGYRWPIGIPPRDTLPVLSIAAASGLSEA